MSETALLVRDDLERKLRGERALIIEKKGDHRARCALRGYEFDDASSAVGAGQPGGIGDQKGHVLTQCHLSPNPAKFRSVSVACNRSQRLGRIGNEGHSGCVYGPSLR